MIDRLCSSCAPCGGVLFLHQDLHRHKRYLRQKKFEARRHVGVAGVGSATFPHSLCCNLASDLATTMDAKSRVVRDVVVISNARGHLMVSHIIRMTNPSYRKAPKL
jgi:hypothetical protein